MEAALQVKEIKDRPRQPMPPEELKAHVEALLVPLVEVRTVGVRREADVPL